ncbi:hypothetical protein FKP32DRAFT_930463 [Trametes sanguinea]|nr:hypothetical protein FKP32DRAFT_930463 [Trametes sanguinea]
MSDSSSDCCSFVLACHATSATRRRHPSTGAFGIRGDYSGSFTRCCLHEACDVQNAQRAFPSFCGPRIQCAMWARLGIADALPNPGLTWLYPQSWPLYFSTTYLIALLPHCTLAHPRPSPPMVMDA